MSDKAAIELAVSYCQDTGEFAWVSNGRGQTRRAGHQAGSINKDGYVRIKIAGRTYLAHRLAWLLTAGLWPAGPIDHINGVRSDNRICNLREATCAQNLCNSVGRSRRKSRFKGVSLDKRRLRWRAVISSAGVFKHLGYFDSEELAHEAYKQAAIEHHGEFARWQ